MKKLADTIAKELEVAHHCAVYNEELARVWPRNGQGQQRQIEKFAKEHGWRVGHYKREFVAIFVKDASSASN